MSSTRGMRQHPPDGGIAYLRLPATDVAGSAAFYAAAFGWSADGERGGFEAPGLIGQWTTDLAPSPPRRTCRLDLGGPAVSGAAAGRGRGRPGARTPPAGRRGALARRDRSGCPRGRRRSVQPLAAHREVWLKDPDGYTVVIASTDGEAYEADLALTS